MRNFHCKFLTFAAVITLVASPLARGMEQITALAVDARVPHTIYAGTYGDGVYRSTDGGSSWNPIGLKITGVPIESLVVDRQTPSTVYAVAWCGIFKTTDRGESWSGLNHPNDAACVSALAIDPSNPSTLYASLYGYYVDEWELMRSVGSVAKSTDGGTTWTSSSAFPSAVLALAIDPLDPTKLVAGTDQTPGWMGPDPYGDVYMSFDAGATWNPRYMWWGSVYLAAAGAPPSTIYVVTSSSAVVNLSTGTVGYPYAPVTLAVDPSDPAKVYVGGGNWVYKSTDAGFRWYPTSPEKNCLGYAECMVTALAVDPANSEILYAGTSDGRVHKSLDSGVTWAVGGATFPPLDSEAPDTSIVSALDSAGASVVAGGATLSRSMRLSFTGTDNVAVANFACRIDGGDFAPCSSPVAYSALAVGEHRFEVRAADAAGNQDASPAAYAWIVDAPPDTTITSALDRRGDSISNGGSTRWDTITLSFAGTDNNGITGFECSLDAGAFASCTSPRVIHGISRGSHSFRVRAVDSRGFRDQTPAAFNWSRH